MEFISYLIECLFAGIDAWAGKGDGTNKGLIGALVLFVIVAVFGVSVLPLAHYTKLKSWQATLCAVAIDIAFVIVFCILAIVIEG